MVRRALQNLFLNYKSSIKRSMIFVALFFLIISSFLISDLSDSFKKEFESNYDITLSISYMDIVPLEFTEELGDRDGVVYSDIEYIWDPPYICFIDIDEDLFVPYYMIAEISQIKNGFSRNRQISDNNGMVQGVEDPDFLYLKYHHSYKINEGRTFYDYELEQGDPVCIVTDEMLSFEDNNIEYVKPGDYIPVSVLYRNNNKELIDSQTEWIKVIGLLNDGQEYFPSVIVPARYLEKLRSISDSFLIECDPDYLENEELYLYNDDLYIESQIIQLDSIESLDKLIEYIDSTYEYNEGILAYTSTISKYSAVLSNVYAVSGSFKQISIICVIVALLLSCVLACLESIYRKKEFMILKSLGEKDYKILMQYALETIIVLVLSAFASTVLSFSVVNIYIEKYINHYNLGSNSSNNPIYSAPYDIYQYAIKPTEIHLSCQLSSKHLLLIIFIVLIIDILSVLFMKVFFDRTSVREVLGNE